jgi:hypothetical protein
MNEKILEAEDFLKHKDVITRLVENPKVFSELVESFEEEDVYKFRGFLEELGILRYCWFICRWLCIKIRSVDCIILCPNTKPKRPTVEEMLEFGRAVVRLMEREQGFRALYDAYSWRDEKKFQSILKEYELMPFCYQFCHWFSHFYCTYRCRLFCPPLANITSPKNLACVQSKNNKIDGETIVGVEIQGVASGGSPFNSYMLEYSTDSGSTWRQDAPGSGETIIVYPDGHRGGVSSTPVGPPPGTLGYLETTNLSPQVISLKLTVVGGGLTLTDVAHFQLHQKAVVINEVGRAPVVLVDPAPPPPEPDRKLIYDALERAVGGYATIGGSAYVEGCGQRYTRYKLMQADGWIPPPAPGTDYNDLDSPTSPWQLIREIDYTGMPIFICFNNNEPVGDLTRRWVERRCLGIFDYHRLEWSPWHTAGSGRKTLLLAVEDDATPPNTYFDSIQIWIDNIPLDAKLDSIGPPGEEVDKCEPMSISEIIDGGGVLEIRGTAWDDLIDPAHPPDQPNLNFERFDVRWKKNCDVSYHIDGISLMPSTDPGKERIKDDVLATWDINDLGLEPCAYIIQLRVWDNSRVNDDGPHYIHRELAFTLAE